MWSKKKDSALLRGSTCFAQYEQQQSMQYFISHVGGDNGQDILNNLKETRLPKSRFKLPLSLKPRIIWAIGFVIWSGKPVVSLYKKGPKR